MATHSAEEVLGARFRRRILVLSGAVFLAVALLLSVPRPEWFTRLVDVSALPWVNAGLNLVAFLLLMAGFVAIRLRRISVHRACMTAAMGVSTLFLCSYVTYHLFSPGPAIYHGPWRGPYLAMLASHVILASIVLPAALNTWARGWTGAVAAHRRVAPPTLAIWSYVSLTGILVTWMAHG